MIIEAFLLLKGVRKDFSSPLHHFPLKLLIRTLAILSSNVAFFSDPSRTGAMQICVFKIGTLQDLMFCTLRLCMRSLPKPILHHLVKSGALSEHWQQIVAKTFDSIVVNKDEFLSDCSNAFVILKVNINIGSKTLNSTKISHNNLCVSSETDCAFLSEIGEFKKPCNFKINIEV